MEFNLLQTMLRFICNACLQVNQPNKCCLQLFGISFKISSPFFFFLTLVSSLREMVGDKPGLFRISVFYLGLIEILLTKIDKYKGQL